MLTLDGADPQLRFGSLGNRAVVAASCEIAAASVHWVHRCTGSNPAASKACPSESSRGQVPWELLGLATSQGDFYMWLRFVVKVHQPLPSPHD